MRYSNVVTLLCASAAHAQLNVLAKQAVSLLPTEDSLADGDIGTALLWHSDR